MAGGSLALVRRRFGEKKTPLRHQRRSGLVYFAAFGDTSPVIGEKGLHTRSATDGAGYGVSLELSLGMFDLEHARCCACGVLPALVFVAPAGPQLLLP
ncbi:MAG TPA: hypothetical protein PLO20_11090 [Thermogutta sp.]|nr:hypothetical protein [Thermogutta sp.]